MFTMVVEYLDPPTVAISQEQRTEFMKNKRPPDLFKIWMGKYATGGRNHAGFYHRAMTVFAPDQPRPETGNVQTTVFALDGLLFYVISAQANYEIPAPLAEGQHLRFCDLGPSDWLNLGLRSLWPIQVAKLSAPERDLDDVDYETLAQMIGEFVNVPGRRLGFIGR